MLFDDVPDLQDYLVDRFSLIGTADECAGRLQEVAVQADLDGMWLALGPSTLIEDPPTMVRTAGRVFAELFDEDE